MPLPFAEFEAPFLERWAPSVGSDWHGYQLGALLAVLLVSAVVRDGRRPGGRQPDGVLLGRDGPLRVRGISLGLLIAFASGFGPAAPELQWLLPLIMAAFGALIGAGIVFVRRRTGLANDTVIGVFFAGAIGFGAMILHGFRGPPAFDPERFLFGGPILVQPHDLLILAILLVLTVLLFLWKYNQFVLASVNPSLARSRRVPVAVNNYLFVRPVGAHRQLLDLRGGRPAHQRACSSSRRRRPATRRSNMRQMF